MSAQFPARMPSTGKPTRYNISSPLIYSSQGINTAAYWRNKQQDRANYGCKLWLDLLIGGSVMRVLGLNSGDPSHGSTSILDGFLVDGTIIP
ncbi:uncharacterized protein [Montipora capricornis]|uniref:uncharacterized protein isoform X4 n=1 Tax=Montipora capricornis TaxID=246305 RepID=UPI0035F124B0